MSQRRLVMAGGSGFLGRALAKHLLATGWQVVNLTRSPRSTNDGVEELRWDGRTVGDWKSALDGADAVVNLTGRSVDCRHNAANRKLILESRVQSVEALGQAIKQCDQPPPVWVQASSLAIYGEPGDRVCDESAPEGEGFSVGVVRDWEAALARCCPPTTRSVALRIGIVLGADGGALPKLAGLARRGLGGTTGSGKQWISWAHVDDYIRMTMWSIENESARGAYNATGPNPSRNRDFMRELRRTLGVWFGPPAPSLAVRIGSFFLGTDASLALGGRRCVPARLLAEGFEFEHVDLVATLRQIFRT